MPSVVVALLAALTAGVGLVGVAGWLSPGYVFCGVLVMAFLVGRALMARTD